VNLAPFSRFLLQDWDDPVDDVCNSTLYARALDEAGVPAEVHLFAKGGHAFGLRPSGHPVVEMWPVLVERWLKEIGSSPRESERDLKRCQGQFPMRGCAIP
jgi:acetyl esterase/lipase